MEYSVVIRTLGKAGEKYEQMLASLKRQTLKPKEVLVFIAENYPIPSVTELNEKYIPVPRGMVSQRALSYSEVTTDYILFLDDDVFLPPNGVETLWKEMEENKGDFISPCVFFNHKVGLKQKLILSLLGREICRWWGGKWGFKVLYTAGFSYNNKPQRAVYPSQTNAGPCFFGSKAKFLSINYQDEKWLESSPYSFPDDQVMFYKMYCRGLKVLTSFDSGIVHLDASSTITNSEEKTRKIIYSEYRNKLIFWHRFLYLPEKTLIKRLYKISALSYAFGIQASKYIVFRLLRKSNLSKAFFNGVKDGWTFIRSTTYQQLPRI